MSLRFRFPAISALAVLVLLGISAVAAAADWNIVKMSGDVRIHRGTPQAAKWVSLKPDRELGPGDAIWTGRNGRVMLAAADGRILVSPRSMVMIPAQAVPGNLTVIFHGFGTVEAEVEKRPSHHFSVQSTFMAAVVKGTRFTVSGNADASRLDVAEGLVQAIDLATGKATDVPAGRFLVIARSARAGGAGSAGSTTVTGGVSTGSPPSAGSSAAGNGKGNRGNGVGNGGGNGTGNEGNGNGPGNGNGGNGGGNGNGNGRN